MKKSNWHKEIEAFRLSSHIILLSGNILDRFAYPNEEGQIMILPDYLIKLFTDIGYQSVTVYDNINGFRGSSQSTRLLAGMLEVNEKSLCADIPFNPRTQQQPQMSGCRMIKRALAQNGVSTVIIMDRASRCIPNLTMMSQENVNGFQVLMDTGRTSCCAKLADGTYSNNLLVMLTEKENDLPAWFYMNNPDIRRISIEVMTAEERMEYFNSPAFDYMFDPDVYKTDKMRYDLKPEELKKIKKQMVGLTEKLMFSDIVTISQLCMLNKFHIHEYSKAVDLFRYGITSGNPWDKMDRQTVMDVENALTTNIIGQKQAIIHTMDMIKRIVSGMSNLNSGNSNKPKGIMFFAGPTGTGKTETAKQLAQKLFLSPDALVTFDMSEYASENSDQRLLGAPPGYVGYEAGGQLTNAAIKNPFSIFLFDEIEKAEPRILDKFLQILGEGRLTDGQGRTVYFSESIIIFTSNLGVYIPDPDDPTGKKKVPNFSITDSYTEIRKKVIGYIEEYFKTSLGRYELLNRIGDNIVVFNFIEDENIRKILKQKVDRVVDAYQKARGITLCVDDAVLDAMVSRFAETSKDKGGRGIENIIESVLLNPVSRYISDNAITYGTVTVSSIQTDDSGYNTASCRHS